MPGKASACEHDPGGRLHAFLQSLVWQCTMSCVSSTRTVPDRCGLHCRGQIAYNASKAAVVKITQTLGCEWADRGVTVNCMSPGIVNTALIQARPMPVT